MSRKGLGRGYEALLGLNGMDDLDNVEVSQQASPLGRVKLTTDVLPTDNISDIAINDIDPNYEQPRKKFDQNKLNEMADTIREYGVIQPIVLVRTGMRYMIIAGERRWRASKIAGKEAIPAVVRDYTPQQIKEISLVENLQREELNPVETARAIKRLMEECSMTQEAVADRIGKSRSAVANTLRLLSLGEDVQQLLVEERLSAGHARALVTVVNEKDQLALARKICTNELSVRDAEKLVKKYFEPKEEKPAQAAEQSIELKELIANMQRIFATRVSAIGNDKKGRIYIDYFTKDDLDRLCEMLDRLRPNE